METNEAHQMYENSEIDSYQLADLLGEPYDQIGAYILSNGLKRVNKDSLYGIECPSCHQKWLIPYQEQFTCGKCKAVITIEY